MEKNNRVCVNTDAFAFELDATGELKTLRWHNHLAGRTLELGGGSELEDRGLALPA
jgi:hypothetical protein